MPDLLKQVTPGRIIKFTKLDDKYYESLSNYKPENPKFRKVLKKSLTEEWNIILSGVWLHVSTRRKQNRRQGFKIHLSAQPQNAIETLKIVLGICTDNNISFKCLSDYRILLISLSKNYERHASGKFITIYPDSHDQFKKLCKLLYNKTKHLDGPQILSDQNYKDSKVVFYRYGAFSKMQKLHIKGFHQNCIKDSDGDLQLDERKPFYFLPPGIEDPFNKGTVNPMIAVK